MTTAESLLALATAATILYGAFLLWLLRAGRSDDARALVRLVPDCLVLLRRVLSDGGVSRTNRLLLLALVGYLALPIDLVPDFVPVAGQLDDALLVALVLRRLVRSDGPDLLQRHWPGPRAALDLLAGLLRGAGDRRAWQATAKRRQLGRAGRRRRSLTKGRP